MAPSSDYFCNKRKAGDIPGVHEKNRIIMEVDKKKPNIDFDRIRGISTLLVKLSWSSRDSTGPLILK